MKTTLCGRSQMFCFRKVHCGPRNLFIRIIAPNYQAFYERVRV